MDSVDTGKETVKRICEVLKEDTLNPAREEAESIIHKAKVDAEHIIQDAQKQAKQMKEAAIKEIEGREKVFRSSLNVACKKTLEGLKQDIEENLFAIGIKNFIGDQMKSPEIITKLIVAIISAIEKEGVDADLRAIIPSTVSVEEINRQLALEVLNRLEEKSVVLGQISAGVQVKMVNQDLTLDMTQGTLESLLSRYVREDFKALIFSPQSER